MTISMYAASVPVFRQMLESLDALLAKADDHASARKIDPQALLQARLFPDMLPLTSQVQIACDFAKGACTRLAGVEVPVHDDKEQSFAELRSRVANVLALITGIAAAQIDGSEDREITVQPGTQRERRFKGQQYLLHYVLPQFYFHVTTAYALLRHNGIEIGKRDYLGRL